MLTVLQTEYEVGKEQLEKDMVDLLNKLLGAGLIEIRH